MHVGNRRRRTMGRVAGGDKTDLSEAQKIQRLLRQAQMTKMNGIETAAEDADGVAQAIHSSRGTPEDFRIAINVPMGKSLA